MRTSIPAERLAPLLARVAATTAAHEAAYPGTVEGRQPVHTAYVPADVFDADTAAAWGVEALRLLDAHAPDGSALAEATGVPPPVADRVHRLVRAKLLAEPVEDLRIDFEDGYGSRPDAEEDGHAQTAAEAVAEALADGSLPRSVGLRVKSFCDRQHERSARTLDGFLTALLTADGGRLPDGFAITFPKVMAADHVSAFADVLQELEDALGLSTGVLGFELQVETTQSIIGPSGEAGLRRFVDAARGRVTAAHFGTFDYTAACGLAPAEQRSTAAACDFARHVMQTSLAGTGVRLSDGSTNVVPASDSRADVHAAWQAHSEGVRHSLRHGFWQGWDMHPSQLVSRFATVYGFHLATLGDTLERLAAWSSAEDAGRGGARRSRAPNGLGGAPAPTPVFGVVDERATIRVLLAHLRRGIDCGAVSEAEVEVRTGIPGLSTRPAHTRV